MGVHLHTFLGPYVQCKYRKTKTQVTIQACMSPDCSRCGKESSVKFCPDCGGAIKPCKMERTSNGSSSYDVVGDDLTDVNGESGGDDLYLAPNLSKGLGRDFFPDEDTHIDLSTLDPAKEIEWFKKKYTKQIEKLRGSFDNVEVKWGLHLYYN